MTTENKTVEFKNLITRCNEGKSKSCISIAARYQNGWGVEINKYYAWIYYKKACDLKNDFACDEFNYLGKKYGFTAVV